MEKILAGGANTDGKEIAAFEQKASFKIRVVRNAYRFCSVIFTALLLCLAGCDNEWDASKDLTIGQDWLEEAETDTADRLESDEILSRRTQLEAAAALWLEGLPDGTDDFEKAKYIYDALILRTEYEQGSADSQNICSVLLNQRSVCQGYAKTFQYLCQLAGIPAMLVTGEVNGEGHAWNIVFLDGDWYYIDPTWGDASYQREEGEETPALTETVNYDYFCVTTQEIERTHSMDDNQLLPVCSAVQDQYYRHEGLYLQSADKEKIDEIFARAAQKGAPMVCFQCADDTVYQEVYRLLIEEQGIFAYLPESETTAAYLDSDRERTFYFWFTEVS